MFISFEGTEGVGKTTLIRKIHQHFEEQGKQVVLTREPWYAFSRTNTFNAFGGES